MSVARQLRTAARLTLVLLGLVVATGWVGLAASSRAASEVERITSAQARHQNIDMAHDEVRAATIAGARAIEQHDDAGLGRARVELATIAGAVDHEFAALDDSDVPVELRVDLRRARHEMVEYLAVGADVLGDGSVAPTAVPVDRYRAFDVAFTRLADELAGITARFAADASSARRTAVATRRQAVAMMLVTAVVAAGVAVASTRQIRRSITRSLAEVAAAASNVAAGDLTARSDGTGWLIRCN
jgi:hypothetical protein